jgi:hypothetical protein
LKLVSWRKEDSTYTQPALIVRNTKIEIQHACTYISRIFITDRHENGTHHSGCGAGCGPATCSESCRREEEESKETAEKVDELHLVNVEWCFVV